MNPSVDEIVHFGFGGFFLVAGLALVAVCFPRFAALQERWPAAGDERTVGALVQSALLRREGERRYAKGLAVGSILLVSGVDFFFRLGIAGAILISVTGVFATATLWRFLMKLRSSRGPYSPVRSSRQ